MKDITPTWEDKKFGVQLYLGDCLEVLPHLGKVDAVVTDPPYEIHAGEGGGAFGKRNVFKKIDGFTDSGINYSFLYNYKNWICFCSLRQLDILLSFAKKCDRRSLLVYCKKNPLPTCNNKYLPDVEFIVHGFSKKCLYGTYKDKSCFYVGACGHKETKHPNEKPIGLMLKLLSSSSDNGHTILDPFMGSGTTGVAAIELGRKFIGVEIEQKYFEIAVKRISDAIIMKQNGPLFAKHKPKQLKLK